LTIKLNLAKHCKDECPSVMSMTARKLKAKKQSLGDLGAPKDLSEHVKAEIARSFNYLVFGQDDLP